MGEGTVGVESEGYVDVDALDTVDIVFVGNEEDRLLALNYESVELTI